MHILRSVSLAGSATHIIVHVFQYALHNIIQEVPKCKMQLSTSLPSCSHKMQDAGTPVLMNATGNAAAHMDDCVLNHYPGKCAGSHQLKIYAFAQHCTNLERKTLCSCARTCSYKDFNCENIPSCYRHMQYPALLFHLQSLL